MQTLKDSELRYRSLFAAAQDGILILDAQTGMIEDVNPFLINMLGYSREEFVKKKLWEVGAFKDIEASKDAFEALQEKEYIRYENLPLKTKDGRLIQVEFVSNVYQAGREKVIQCNIRDITEHKRIVAVLQENEKKYFNLLNQSSDGVFIIDLAGNILTVNKAMCRELEFSEEEFLSMNIWDIIPEQYLDQYRERLTKILAGESFEQAGEYEVRGKNGRNHFVEVLSTPHYSGKNIVGFQGIARDITARKQAEQALNESEARNRRLVDHLPTVVYTNAVGDVSSALYVSPQIQTLLGYTPQEWLADPDLWSKALYPEDRQQVLAQVAATNQTKKPFEMEYRMVARDGHLVWVQDQIVLMNEMEGHGQLWQGIMLDITDRKQAEEKLSESEQRYRQIIETAQEGIWTLDAANRTTLANQHLADMLGYTVQEMLGRSVYDFMDEEGKAIMATSLENRQQGINEQLDFKYKHKDGSTVWALIETSTLLDHNQQYMGALAMLTDITKRKQAEQALQESEKRFRALVENNSDAITLLDERGIALYDSPAAPGMLGYASDDWIGQDVFALIHPDDLPRMRDLFEKLVKTPGARDNSTFRLHHKSGSWLWIEMVTTNLLAEPGVNAIVLNYHNITERKQAEIVLYESEERFKNAFQYSAIGMALVSLEGKCLKVNSILCSMLGYSQAELLTKTFQQITHPEDLEGDLNLLNQLLTGEINSYKMEKRYLHKTGGIVRAVLAVALARDSAGTPLYFLAQIDDTTEFKLAEAAMHESDERFRQVWEATSDAMALSDSQGIVLANNPAYLSLYGYKVEEVIGRSFAVIFPEENREAAVEQYKIVFADDHMPSTFESVIRRADGTERLVETRITFLSAAGQRTAMLSTIRDITDRKRAEAEIHQRLSELEVLYQSGLALSQLVNPKAIAQKMIDLLDQKMDWHHTVIRLYDPQNEKLELLVFNQPGLHTQEEYDIVEKRLKQTITDSTGGLSGWAIQNDRIVRSNDLQNDPRYIETFSGLQSGLYVPMKTKESIIGVISIESELPRAFSESDERLASTLAAQAAIAIENAQLFTNLKRSNIDLELAYDATIEGWSHALDLRDKETEGHSQRVTELTVELARSFGLSEKELVQVRWGSLLHDIGKMGVTDGILLKPGSLTEDEWAIMKKHPRFAYDLLSPIRYLKLALDIPYCHHEKWDGSGYPRGLKGEQIPLSARIFAVVDVWDALCSDRPYRAGWAKEKVRKHIRGLSGTHFDPQVVDGFMKVIE